MKAFVVCAMALAALATVEGGFAGGHSNSFRKQDDYGNYAFSYDIANAHGAVNGRKESGGPHGVTGSYHIKDIDGRHRTVHYVADKAGFRAQIKTNEPGTKTSYAAAAAYSSANGKGIPSGGLHGAAHFAGPVFAKAPVAYGHGYGIGPGFGHGGYGHGHGGYGHAVQYATHGVAAPAYGIGHGGYGGNGIGFGHGHGHLGIGFGHTISHGGFGGGHHGHFYG